MAFAAWADVLGRFAERRAQALARHFQQAETRDAADLHACAVQLERVAQAFLDLALVLGRFHVDEVDDDQAAHVADAQLAGDLDRGFEVGVERGFLDVAALGRLRRVDVDGGQRFGGVDHNGAARGQAHGAVERVLDLHLDLEAREQRHRVLVQLQLAQILRHHLLHELASVLVQLFLVDQDFADVVAQVIAQGADHQLRLLVDQERGRAALGRFGDGLPDLKQIVQVPLQLFRVAAEAGGADDQAHLVGELELVHRFLEVRTILALDAARDATGARIVRHQHQVTTGQADERGQGRALVAAFFLVDLDDDLAAFLQQFADAGLVRVEAGREVLAADFLQRQEAVALAAVFDETGLEAGFDAGDASLVDVRFLLLARRDLDIEVKQVLAIDDSHAQLFPLSCVDQHTLHCECFLALRARRPLRHWIFRVSARGAFASPRCVRLSDPAAVRPFGRNITGVLDSVGSGPNPDRSVTSHRGGCASALSARACCSDTMHGCRTFSSLHHSRPVRCGRRDKRLR